MHFVGVRQLQDYSCGRDSLGVRHTRPDTTTPVIYIYIHTIYTVSQYQRLDDVPSDCPCDWQMGGKKKERAAGKQTHVKRSESRGRGRDSEDATNEMSCTSSEKRRLAHTREQLRPTR